MERREKFNDARTQSVSRLSFAEHGSASLRDVRNGRFNAKAPRQGFQALQTWVVFSFTDNAS